MLLVILLCEALVRVSIIENKARSCVRVLMTVANALRSSENTTLTPFHSFILEACVAGQLYQFGVQYMSSLEIYHISEALTPAELLTYYHYGGLWLVIYKYTKQS